MAKGQVRSNREAKKPKQTKKLTAPVAAAGFASPKTAVSGGTGSKAK